MGLNFAALVDCNTLYPSVSLARVQDYRMIYLSLQVCSILAPMADLNMSNMTSNHTESTYMPDIIYYQVMRPNNTDCMHYAWSAQMFPTLFISHTEGQCLPKNTCNISYNLEEFSQSQSYGSVDIPGKDGDFAMAIIFHQLIEFNVTSKHEASDLFDPSQVGNASNPEYKSTYLNQSELEWSSNIEDKSLMAKSLEINSTLQFTIRVSACVYCGVHLTTMCDLHFL